jgi:chromosome segregation ATPase
MAFPEEAVYGNLHQSALQQQQQWDGRDDTNSTYPQTPTEEQEEDVVISNSNSDNDDEGYEDLVHIASRDDEGNPCAEIEVTRTITLFRSPTNSKRGPSSSSTNHHHHLHSLHNQEELSPHIDTNNPPPPMVAISLGQILLNNNNNNNNKNDASSSPPQLPLSPSSINSIGTDLTDLEHKMTHEVNTVKQWLSKVQSDRDRYRAERNMLQQRLDVADAQRMDEVAQVQQEFDLLKEKADEQIEMLLEDLHTSKIQLQEMNSLAAAGGSLGNHEEMKKQLELIKAKLILTEEALDQEKSSSSLREATKLEEARQSHFEEFKLQLVEMEQKFRIDLATVRSQKETEVQSLQEELDTAKSIQEHLACQIDTKENELQKVQGTFEKLSREHQHCPTSGAMEEAVQKVREEMMTTLKKVMAEKEGLMSQLESKDMELIKVKGEYTNEHDRMKEQLSNLTKLVETKTMDLTKSHEMTTSLQKELCTSKIETTKAMEQITILSEENFQLKQIVETMNQARIQYEHREKERMGEVLRLQTKVEEIHSLVPSQSHDDSSSKEGGGEEGGRRVNNSSTKAKVVACAAVPNLDDDGETASVVENYDVNEELEATRKKLMIAERDSSTIADLKEKLNKAEKLYVEVAVENSELKAKLRGSPKHEKTEESSESMTSELKSIKATLLIKNAEIATLKRRVFMKENQEAQSSVVEHLKNTVEEAMKFKDQVIGEIASHLEDKQQQQQQQLAVSVADATTSETAADVPAGIRLGNDIDDIKQEHRVEMKLLMEKYASLKTQVKLVTKEKDEIARAYEVEQACSAELESSLQEIVALLEAERSMHSGKMNELKVIKHKFSKLKKKRVPVDAAYKASLMLLEQLERKKIASQSSGETEKVMKAAIGLINSLTHAIEKEDSAELSLASSKDSFSSSLPDDDKHTKALSEACEKLELAMLSIKMQLSSKTIEYEELLKAKTSDAAMHQEAVAALKQQLSEFNESDVSSSDEKEPIILEVAQQEKDALKQQLQDAETKCETLQAEKTKLVGEVTRAKESSKMMQKETEVLNQQLQHAETRVEDLLGLIQEMRDAQLLNEDASEAYEERLDELRATIDSLQNEKEEGDDLAQKCESLEAENKKLMDEVARAKESYEEKLDELRATVESLQNEKEEGDELAHKCESLEAENKKLMDEVAREKESFEEVMADFEQTLTDTCEAHEKALREKQEECTGLNEQLERLMKALTEVTSSTEEAPRQEIAKLSKDRHEVDGQPLPPPTPSTRSKRELDERLRTFEKNLLAEAIKHEVMQQENESMKQQIQDAKTKYQTLEDEKKRLVGEVTRAKKSFEQVIAEFEEELKATCAASEQALSEKQEQCKELNEQLERLKEELSDSKETSLQEITRLTDMASADKASMAELQKELDSTKEEMQRISDLLQDHDKLLEELREELADSEESERALQAVIAIHEASIDRLKKESKSAIDEVKEELEDTNKALKDSVEVCLQLRSEVAAKDALARENKSLGEKLQSLYKTKSGLESQAATHDQAISMIEHELETVRSEITLKNRQVQVAQEEKEKTKHELDMAIQSMEEVVESLQKQIKVVESEKELNRGMYEKDIQLQQQEVEALQKKHTAAMSDLDSLSELISNLKASLESEKENGKILLVQFNKSEEDRKAQFRQKTELEKELAATMQSVDELTEQIRCLEADLAVAITEEEERELREKVSSQEQELKELRAKVGSIEKSKQILQDEYKATLHKKEEESTKLRVILQEAKDKLSRLHSENEKLRHEHSEAVNSMSVMLNDAVRGRAETDMSLQESIHLLEKQKRMDIKKNTQLSKLEHELQILRTKERYQESMIASLKNQIKRGR